MISLNPTLKHEWYKEAWFDHVEMQHWIAAVSIAAKELWFEEYKGKYSTQSYAASSTLKLAGLRKEEAFISARNHKRLKISHQPSEPPSASPSVDLFN